MYVKRLTKQKEKRIWITLKNLKNSLQKTKV